MATQNVLNNAEIPDSLISAKGDLISGTADDVPDILNVGGDGEILTAASGEGIGLVWTNTFTDDKTFAADKTLAFTDADVSATRITFQTGYYWEVYYDDI